MGQRVVSSRPHRRRSRRFQCARSLGRPDGARCRDRSRWCHHRHRLQRQRRDGVAAAGHDRRRAGLRHLPLACPTGHSIELRDRGRGVRSEHLGDDRRRAGDDLVGVGDAYPRPDPDEGRADRRAAGCRRSDRWPDVGHPRGLPLRVAAPAGQGLVAGGYADAGGPGRSSRRHHQRQDVSRGRGERRDVRLRPGPPTPGRGTLATRPFRATTTPPRSSTASSTSSAACSGGSEGKVQIYDPATNTWTPAPPCRSPPGRAPRR